MSQLFAMLAKEKKLRLVCEIFADKKLLELQYDNKSVLSKSISTKKLE